MRSLRRLALLALVAATIAVVLAARAAFDASLPARTTLVTIAPGSAFGAAARALEAAGVARAAPLRLLARLRGREADLVSGTLIFPPHETAFEALDRLTTRARLADVWVTVPEGYTAAEIERRLAAARLPGAVGFARYARRASIRLGGVRTASLEGYLFPETYALRRDASTAEIAAAMVAEFRRRLPADAARRAKRLGYTLPQVVTVASLVEREAKAAAERPLMAGVYYRRLRIGMPLEVDATLEYGLPRHRAVLTEGDVRRDTPYNTYLHAGLPPTPIANPGASALRAALRPRATTYLYYVYKGGGRHAFAKTYGEHQANIARYLR